MRKAFKVATVFTGAAACAAACATALAPAAGAVTTMRAQQAVPATSKRNCAIGPRTHLRWSSGGRIAAHHGPTCVGGANSPSKNAILGVTYTKYCPGNNFGDIFTNNPNIPNPSIPFAPGQDDDQFPSQSQPRRVGHYQPVARRLYAPPDGFRPGPGRRCGVPVRDGSHGPAVQCHLQTEEGGPGGA